MLGYYSWNIVLLWLFRARGRTLEILQACLFNIVFLCRTAVSEVARVDLLKSVIFIMFSLHYLFPTIALNITEIKAEETRNF